MKHELHFNGEVLDFGLERNGELSRLSFQGNEYDVQVSELSSGVFRLQNSNGALRARVIREKDKCFVWVNGRTFEFTQPAADSDSPESEAFSKNELHAPMPGTVIKIAVSVGDEVAEGQTVAVVEAMKMEHNLRAPRAGKIAQVNAKVGEIVGTETALVMLRDED